MISQEAFEKGIYKLEKYIKSHPNDKWLLAGRMTLTAGYKSGGQTNLCQSPPRQTACQNTAIL